MAVKHRLQALEKRHGVKDSVEAVLARLERMTLVEQRMYYSQIPTPVLRQIVSNLSGVPVEELTRGKLIELIANNRRKLAGV